jgi:hypothetical protein
MKLEVLGIDLGKRVFHMVGLDSAGTVVIRKRCSRTQLLACAANLQVQLIGMEACSGAHFLGRALREQGHEVRLMPAQLKIPVYEKQFLPGLLAENRDGNGSLPHFRNPIPVKVSCRPSSL